jgi:hypothetical protein
VALDAEEAVLEGRQTGDVVGGQDLALHHGEIDLDLIGSYVALPGPTAEATAAGEWSCCLSPSPAIAPRWSSGGGVRSRASKVTKHPNEETQPEPKTDPGQVSPVITAIQLLRRVRRRRPTAFWPVLATADR